MLITTLKKMNYRGGDHRTHKFIETFLVLAYFRIVGFRERLLECLKKKSFGSIKEWRAVEGDLEVDTSSDDLLPILDWKKFFYDQLPTSDDEELVIQWLDHKRWQEVMGKRKQAYFQFIRRWILHIHAKFVKTTVP